MTPPEAPRREKKLVITLDLVAGREPFAYAGMASVPEEMRVFALRELLKLGISWPATVIPNNSAPPQIRDPDATIVHKLTFFKNRTEDAALYDYFDGISRGRRRATARAVLVKGLMLRAVGTEPAATAPQQVASPVPSVMPSSAPPRQEVRETPVAPGRQSTPRRDGSFGAVALGDVPVDLLGAVPMRG